MIDLDITEDFTSLDVELANSDYTSICEVGIARFRGGQLVETWRVLVNPESEFEAIYHTNIHGIHDKHINGAPTFPDIYSTLKRFTDNEFCIYHASSGFDQACISKACKKYSLDDLTQNAQWQSTLHLAMKFWPTEESYKLSNLCKKIGHDYHQHNALEDAIAAAVIYRAVSGNEATAAIPAVGGGGDRPRSFRRIATRSHKTGLKGNPEGRFYKTFVVVSGTFSPPWDDRGELERYLDSLGFVPRGNISGRTQILVTGESPGPKKIVKAEQQNIKIMSEGEFFQYIESGSKSY